MIANTNKERNTINHLVRNKMIETGVIIGERQLNTLSAVDMNDVDKLFAQNYTQGQVVIANKQGILGRNGEQGIVVSTDVKANTITVKKLDSSMHTIKLSQSAGMISVFNQRKKQIGIGERILFGRNNKKLNVKNGQTGILIAINGDMLTVKKQGKSIAIDIKEYPYLDYSYCISDVKAQGKTSKNVIVAAHSQRSSRASFYVQLTRAKQNLQFFVNDAVKFRIGIESQKFTNSTLQKTMQGVRNDRRASHTRAVVADESNHAINQRSQPGYGINAVANTKQYHIYGKPSINDRCDLHDANGPFKRVGWKLGLCRFGRFFETFGIPVKRDTRLFEFAKQQNEDNELNFTNNTLGDSHVVHPKQ
jgi:hypothetical protein